MVAAIIFHIVIDWTLTSMIGVTGRWLVDFLLEYVGKEIVKKKFHIVGR
jgi:hypothetical protein